MIAIDSLSQSFEKAVELWIFEAIENNIRDFSHLVTALPSVDPTYILGTLRQLHQNHSQYGAKIAQLMLTAQPEPSALSSFHDCGTLPPPHPLDYDWRFSEVALERLFHHCIKTTPSDGTIVLLGAPTLFRFSHRRSTSQKIVLFDSNKSLSGRLGALGNRSEAMFVDLLREELPTLAAYSVVLDPPWYREHIHSFLWAAAQFCRIGGDIYVSFPPIGTRPGMEQEWDEVLDWTKCLGLRLVSVQELALPYTTPPFEKNAFKYSGTPSVPDAWRRGNLVTFRKEAVSEVPRPFPLPDEDLSREIQLSSVRIRFRPWQETTFADPRITSILPNDVLTSISRRDSRRQLADLWTSGNRIFQCQGRGTLYQIIEALSDGQHPATSIELHLGRALSARELKLVHLAIEQILSLVRTEQKENSLCGYYWSKNANLTLAAS